MIWLLEDPTLAIFVLVTAVGLGWAGWSQTGETRWLGAGVGLFAVGAIMLLAELLIETDQEQITGVIQHMATSCERQDIDGLLSDIDPAAVALRARAEGAVTDHRVTRMKVSRVRVKVNTLAVPPTAHVEFKGVIHGSTRRALPAEVSGVAVADFALKFRKSVQEDRWLCTDADFTVSNEPLGD